MRPASRPPYWSSSCGRAVETFAPCSERLSAGRCGAGFAGALGFALVLARVAAAAPLRVAAAVVRLPAAADLAAAVWGRAVPAGLVTCDDRLAADAALEVPALPEEDAVLVVLDLAAPEVVLAAAAGVAAAGLATDMAFAASVSDFVAAVMALVAAFIACIAVDIVLADDVAFVAAAVIFVAAAPTLVAADETVRAAVAVDGAFLDAVVRPVTVAVARARVAGRLDSLLLADLVRVLLAGLRRAAVRVVVRAGTDLPPS
jgi:hypothetical protein